MIKRIYLNNFRSIKKNADVTLTPLTVIVGANNSGKSNLIKAIDFIGNVSRDGLRTTVRRYGGFKEVLPKGIPDNDLTDKRFSLSPDGTFGPSGGVRTP
ncbi:MAG: AAA family ATPase [Methanomassiliicoccus sp.]|nr:AAA family ATPase [Methanomassiliicoccus sp.]